MRVVFDSNIIVSALILPGGRADLAVLRGIEGIDQLVISQAIVDEVLSVLARKFARDREELARVALFLTELGKTVHPRRRLHVLADETDNRILKCAVAGDATMIVTGDRVMLRLGQYEAVRIVSLAEYLSL